MSPLRLVVSDRITRVDAQAWDRLAGETPFLRHAYLAALEDSGCVGAASGWEPRHLLLYRDEHLVAALPQYRKWHSRGEYVFDHAWAHAFAQHGLDYYPKLVAAVPFTPVAGSRLLAEDCHARRALINAALDHARSDGVSSLHLLFLQTEDRLALAEAGFLLREGVQFHWRNEEYVDFDAFLARMTHDKRKKIRQDRQRVAKAGIHFESFRGEEITPERLEFFYRCYVSTYREHGAIPYLSLEFFQSLLRAMPEAMLLIAAFREGQALACALDIIGADTLYGRYWGTLEFIPGLHFETCYNQSIEYCIRNGIARFEGGAQGVHKLARGLLPVPTWSAHWIADARFSSAIGDFLERETRAMELAVNELQEHSPFKSGFT